MMTSEITTDVSRRAFCKTKIIEGENTFIVSVRVFSTAELKV